MINDLIYIKNNETNRSDGMSFLGLILDMALISVMGSSHK